jgi:hypothetical protein
MLGHHVHGHAGEQGLAIQLAKISERRAAVIVDEYVGSRAGRQQRGLALGRGDVGGHRSDADARGAANVFGGLIEQCAVAPVDDQ